MRRPEDLLAWFDLHRRDLPWRRTRDPYRIWLSEVMLQQTRVETVLPFYNRFLERFPTAEDLAGAGIEEVLALWSGLGYYRRARQLHAAASELLDRERPGDSNQALMELGATLCSPRRPKCLLCPLRPGCRAAREGDPDLYPVARVKRQGERHRLVVAVVEKEEGVLLFRRPEDSALLAGTWELPWVTAEVDGVPGERPPEAALAHRYGGQWTLVPRVAGVRHGITYRDLEVA